MGTFKLSSTGYAFTFQAMANIPQKYLAAASFLSEAGYSIPTILPVGDSVPNDIPIILLRKSDDASQISICRNKCTIIFPPNTPDSDQDEAVNKVQVFLKEFAGELKDLHYFGINKTYQLVCNTSADIIRKKVSFLDTFANISDINISFSEILENRFYANSQIANSRIYSVPVNPNEKGFLKANNKDTLIVNIDVNNRYAFNMGQSVDDFDNELSSIKRILKEKEDQILKLFEE